MLTKSLFIRILRMSDCRQRNMRLLSRKLLSPSADKHFCEIFRPLVQHQLSHCRWEHWVVLLSKFSDLFRTKNFKGVQFYFWQLPKFSCSSLVFILVVCNHWKDSHSSSTLTLGFEGISETTVISTPARLLRTWTHSSVSKSYFYIFAMIFADFRINKPYRLWYS